MKSDQDQEKTPRPSTLPFDPAEVMGIRVRPADLARIWEVSKQAVSVWIKKGIISTYPDGSIDPKKAMKEYLANTDGSRMRANFMRTVSSEVDDLRAANQGMAATLERTHEALQRSLVLLAEQSAWLEKFSALVDELGEQQRAASAEQWADLVQELFEQAGEHAAAADPAEVLAGIEDGLAALWQPAQP